MDTGRQQMIWKQGKMHIKTWSGFLSGTRTSILALGLLFYNCNPSGNNEPTPGIKTADNAGQASQGAYATVNGLRMYYEIHGKGMPLVLIHGGGSTISTTFGRVLPQLAKTHKVIAVEMQAHGRTEDIDRPLSFEQDADDVAALLRHLKITKANVFGFSNGANTTLQLAIRHPELVNKIVVASTFYSRDGAQPWFWDVMKKATFSGMPQPFKDAFLAVNPDTNALRRMYERDVARMRSFPEISDAQMTAIKSPAFIIIGDADVVTPAHALEMQRLLPGSRLAVIPGGHGDYIGEITTPQDPVLVAATVSMVSKFLVE